jgi:integrase
MASIHKRPSGNWHVSFRFGGRQFNPSLKTGSRKKAETVRGNVEETIRLLEMGRLVLPDGATPQQMLTYILSSGKLNNKPKVGSAPDLETVIEEYFAVYKVGKEDSTVLTEQVHARHFMRIIGEKTRFDSISIITLQEYVAQRSKEKGRRGNGLSPDTISKELETFAQIWSTAVTKGYANGDSPTRNIKLDLPDEKPPFKTWNEIKAIIKRGGLTKEQEKEYWDSLFLDEKQVLKLLTHVKENAEHPFIYAAISFAAFTGARRSEIMRSQIEDWDFERGIVRITQQNGSRKKKTTLWEINIHPKLEATMEEWLENHPGGIFTIVIPPDLVRSRVKQEHPMPMTRNQAHYHFQRAIAGSKWEVLKGWHVLRHSFCSNCARRGLPDTVIDTWMGHRGDEEIKKRYRHLFPTDKRKYIETLFT